jgi:hypothetical protein
VLRDREWFQNNIGKLEKVWKTIEEERVTGYEHRAPNKRVVNLKPSIEKCEGSSLFNLDLTRMQMFYIDYSWYGAGAIRFGFKNNRGEVMYVHRMVNNNINTEAYMRSGNLPARYEVNTIAPYTYLTQTLANTAPENVPSRRDGFACHALDHLVNAVL